MTDAYSRAWDLTELVLGALVAEFATAEVELPPRQYATAGTVYYDNEQLTVSLIRLFGANELDGSGTSSPSEQPMRCLMWEGAEFEIFLMRCAPTLAVHPDGSITAPPIEQQQAFGELLARDAMIMRLALVHALRDDVFGMGPVLSLGGWEPIGESDLAGGALRVKIGLA